MTEAVRKALAAWGWLGAPFKLVAARENAVYRVETPEGPVALRVHRQGYRSDAELRSELSWMGALAKGGLSVPAPMRSVTGQLLHVVDGVQVDALTWLDGVTFEAALPQADRPRLFHDLGQHMARLHLLSDAWRPQADFVRCHWSRAGLVGDHPLWDRFWENPGLGAADQALFKAFRQAADGQLQPLETTLDYGLIHADLVPANVMVDDARMHLIDFDDGGFGFRIFDVATALLKHRQRADYANLQAALLTGYRQVRPLDTTQLPLFMALRAATYVGWNITRMNEDTDGTRNDRFIAAARDTIQAVLQTK